MRHPKADAAASRRNSTHTLETRCTLSLSNVWFIDARTRSALSFQLFSGCLSCFVYGTHTHGHTHTEKILWFIYSNALLGTNEKSCLLPGKTSARAFDPKVHYGSSVWRLSLTMRGSCWYCSCWKIATARGKQSGKLKCEKEINLNSWSMNKYVYNMANTWSANGIDTYAPGLL